MSKFRLASRGIKNVFAQPKLRFSVANFLGGAKLAEESQIENAVSTISVSTLLRHLYQIALMRNATVLSSRLHDFALKNAKVEDNATKLCSETFQRFSFPHLEGTSLSPIFMSPTHSRLDVCLFSESVPCAGKIYSAMPDDSFLHVSNNVNNELRF